MALVTLALFCVPATRSAEDSPEANEDSSGGFTAVELYNRAQGAMQQGDFAQAVECYRRFFADFGTSGQLADRLGMLRFEYAMALLRTGDLAAAHPLIEEALASLPPPDEQAVRELTFWRGVALMQEERFPDAREALEKFVAFFPDAAPRNPAWRATNPGAAKLPEAKLLLGAAWLLEGKSWEGIAYLEKTKEDASPENRGRATVLQLYGWLGGESTPERRERALALVLQEFPRIEHLTQIAAFQVMTLQLGSSFLDNGEYRRAIQCLQRVWDSERLLRHQEKRLADLEARQIALDANPSADPYARFLVAQMLAKVRRELETFQAIENFDAALRLRLAYAYHGMGRFREAALIMEDMLERMPPDPIVESVSVSLLQSWNAIERWPKSIHAARQFEAKFAKSGSLPLVLYLRGIAGQNGGEYSDATATFRRVLEEFPKSEYAPRALFMLGFTHLLAEDNRGAIDAFEQMPQKFPRHEMLDAAAYWRGMGFSLAKEFVRAREVMDEYLGDFPDGQFRGAAAFRKAYAAQQLMDFPTAITELRDFLESNPGHESTAEALVLLGDALMNEGQMEEGIAAFQRIPPEQTRFFEEGWFKVARAYKEMERPDDLLAHMARFVEEYPGSPRIAEALFQIAETHRKAGDMDTARRIYWEVIEKYAGDEKIRSVEQLFPALARLHRDEDARRDYLTRLRGLVENGEENPVLRMRALWASAAALKKSEPETARAMMIDASALANPSTTNPLLLSDFAKALAEAGNTAAAERMNRDLVKWNPRSPFKDHALAEIGFHELENGREADALKTFERFEREHPNSPRIGAVLLAKAAILAKRGQDEDALPTLDELLASEAATGREKAEALYRIGETHLRADNPKLAIPYFQRVYVMYGRWGEWVARSYLGSAKAFEKLDDIEAARRSYMELAGREELSDFPESEQAKKRLEQLGAPRNPDAAS